MARSRTTILGLCILAMPGAGVAQTEPAAGAATKESFIAAVRAAFAGADLSAGIESDAAFAAARKRLADDSFVDEYEAAMAKRFGPACKGLGLDAALESVVADSAAAARGEQVRLTGVSHYLARVQLACSRRLREDSALLTDFWKGMQEAPALRRERYAEHIAEQRKREAEREEEKRRLAEAEVERKRIAEAEALKAAEEIARAERERLERERLAAKPGVPKIGADAPLQPGETSASNSIVGTFRCMGGEQRRVMHFSPAGEVIDLISVGQSVLGFGGRYDVRGDRIIARFVADNAWKVFALNYEQTVEDRFAWKRSAIASQKVSEFRIASGTSGGVRPVPVRSRNLKSGQVTEAKPLDCWRLASNDALHRAMVGSARFAARYMDKERDRPPPQLQGATLSLTGEIEFKKRKELEWFVQAPGLLKMMATDRLLTELRASSAPQCEMSKMVFERSAAAAMGAINKIGESELAKSNPARAEDAAGRQLDPAFEEFLDSASRAECMMEESSAVGL